jgi:hypothetical protein
VLTSATLDLNFRKSGRMSFAKLRNLSSCHYERARDLDACRLYSRAIGMYWPMRRSLTSAISTALAAA